MAGREFLGKLIRRTSHPVAALSILLLLLAVAGAAGLSRKTSTRLMPARSVTATPAPLAAPVAASATVSGQERAAGRTVIGEIEGVFDAATRSFKVTEVKPTELPQQEYATEARTDASSTLPAGSYSFRFVNIAYLPGVTVSAEVEIGNKTSSYTFYNTRLIFTHFRKGSRNGNPATTLPDDGLNFYNDGQVAVEGQLGVSRDFGDIPAGTTKTAIWTFLKPASGPTFWYRAVIVADLGVAAESVEPAAVQVTTQAGSSVKVNGRGFTGTPTVDLVDENGNKVGNSLSVSNVTATSLTAAIPAGTSPGIYGIRVTNPGGTPGGLGSSTLVKRLSVTPPPTQNLAALVNGSGGTGPYLLSGGTVTISSEVSIAPGTVIYVDPGTTLQLTGTGNFIANGGIPGVPGGAGISSPAQIVFTANRAPGAGLPAKGAWGGINATAASNATMTMRNVVVEYGGASCGAAVDITGSGRTLRFSDGIVRQSAGTGLKGLGVNDALIGFTRSRIENNGNSAACDAAVQLSANAALGLFGQEPTTGTAVYDASFYYSSANVFAGNIIDAVQVGSDSDAASNDFTKSGVLVGQGSTPIQIRGSSTNPAIVGKATAPGAELVITANALIQLAPGTDFQAGSATLFGGIAANGAPGYTQVPGATPNSSSQRITFQKIPGGGNWGALYFSPKSSPSSILNYVMLDGGGAGGIAPSQFIVDGTTVTFSNSQSSNSSSAGYLVVNGGSSPTPNSVFLNNAPVIDTIAGSHLGDGNKAVEATVPGPAAIVVDPGRGIYIADRDPADSNYSVIRFVNTSSSSVVIAGRTIPAGKIQTIAGGGLDQLGTDNIPATQANLDLVGGLALSPDKNLLYFTTGYYSMIRVLNVSPGASISSANPDAGAINVGGTNIRIGNIGTFYNNSNFVLSAECRGLAVHPDSGEVYVADAGNNKIFRITTAGVISTFAGNGATTADVDDLPSGNSSPTGVPLLKPSDVKIDTSNGNNIVYISDSGHGRIIKVTLTSGANSGLSLVAQLGQKITSGSGRQILDNPYPTGLALFGDKLYFANSNKHTIQRVVSTNNVVTVAGQDSTACDPTSGSCGDGGAAAAALLSLPTASYDLPVAGLAADASGLYLSDQARFGQGRVRYINLTGSSVNVAGVTVAGNSIASIAGAGFVRPYNGGLATSAELARPVGVAVDNNNNLFIAESEVSNSSLRFVNRGNSNVTLPDGAGGVLVTPGTIVKVNNGANAVTSTPIPINQASFGTLQGVTFVNGLGLFIVDTNAYTVQEQTFRVKAGRLYYYNTTNSTQTIYPQAASIGGSAIVVPSGYVVTIAGRTSFPEAGSGSGTTGLSQRLVGATDVAVHPTNGNIYIASSYFALNNSVVSGITSVVYKIDRNTGSLTTLSLQTDKRYTGLAFDTAGKLYIANYDNNTVLQETGSNTGVFNTLATVSQPRDVAVDAAGNVYVTSSGSQQIIKIAGGSTSGFAGNAGSAGFSGDNGGATSAQINLVTDLYKLSTDTAGAKGYHMTQIVGITVGAGNEVIFTDTGNFRVRRVR